MTCGSPGMPTATVRMTNPDDEERIGVSIGTGPVTVVTASRSPGSSKVHSVR